MLLAIKEYKLKPWRDITAHLLEWLKYKILAIQTASKYMKQLELYTFLVQMLNITSSLENSFIMSNKVIHTLPGIPVILLPSTYPKDS